MLLSCCALHNFCEDKTETVHPTWSEEAARLERDLQSQVSVAAPQMNALEGRTQDVVQQVYGSKISSTQGIILASVHICAWYWGHMSILYSLVIYCNKNKTKKHFFGVICYKI